MGWEAQYTNLGRNDRFGGEPATEGEPERRWCASRVRALGELERILLSTGPVSGGRKQEHAAACLTLSHATSSVRLHISKGPSPRAHGYRGEVTPEPRSHPHDHPPEIECGYV